jgi:ABC-type phosphate/phosphonate transport system substrate-binding protein
MIAALPMYDRPVNAAAHDRLWAMIRDGLRDRGLAAPDALDRAQPYDAAWGRNDLVLGQICNLPLRAKFRDRVTIVGASEYALSGCPAGHYASVVVVQKDAPETTVLDALQQRFACNDVLSHSGFGAAWMLAQDGGITLTPHLITGAHALSLAAVADGTADCATLDAQTWWMLQSEDSGADQVRVIGKTGCSPCMTFITRLGEDPAPYFDAIHDAITALSEADRTLLGLRAIVTLPASDYDLPIPDLSRAS